MKAITELENLGYVFSTNNDNEAKISFQYTGEGEPDPERVDPLLEELKSNRQEVLTYLQARATEEQVPLNSPQPAACAPEDPFMVLFQETLRALCQVAGVQDDGFTPWLERYRAELAKRIDRAEEKLDELWGNDKTLFQAELRRYRDLSILAIRHYKATRKEAGKQ